MLWNTILNSILVNGYEKSDFLKIQRQKSHRQTETAPHRQFLKAIDRTINAKRIHKLRTMFIFSAFSLIVAIKKT